MSDVLAGPAAVAAVIVSICLAWQAGRRRQRGLASKVTLVSERGFDPEGKEFRTYQVHNGGDQPITKVRIVERPSVGETRPTAGYDVKWWNSIEAGGQRTAEIRYVPGEALLQVHPANRSLIFHDGSGRWWERKELGGLSRLKKTDPDSPDLYLSS